VAVLRDPGTIRARCGNVLARGLAGELGHFAVALDRLAAAADLVADVTRHRYPSLAVPLHSRWRHFDAGGVDRAGALGAALAGLPAAERARARCDLAAVSVLLDAGAGAAWSYRERQTGLRFARSEGLAVATLRMFEAGVFSSDPSVPWRADAAALEALDDGALAAGLQVAPANPMAGFAERAALVRRLGAALRAAPAIFGAVRPRIGNLVDTARARARAGRIEASEILALVLEGLEPIWPEGATLEGRRLGDTWPHPLAGGEGATAGLVPLHKLPQWLAYSLVEPLQDAGLAVAGLDRLTALAEYRNGGLLIDLGVLVPRHGAVTGAVHGPGSEVVVEWRALTVGLLDRLAPEVIRRLGLSPGALPMAAVLEGGTWAAGRALAEERRGGAPPIRVAGTGTVF
jgi:hypothetical protein